MNKKMNEGTEGPKKERKKERQERHDQCLNYSSY